MLYKFRTQLWYYQLVDGVTAPPFSLVVFEMVLQWTRDYQLYMAGVYPVGNNSEGHMNKLS